MAIVTRAVFRASLDAFPATPFAEASTLPLTSEIVESCLLTSSVRASTAGRLLPGAASDTRARLRLNADVGSSTGRRSARWPSEASWTRVASREISVDAVCVA